MNLKYNVYVELEANGIDPDWMESHMLAWAMNYSDPDRMIPLMTRWLEAQDDPHDVLDAINRGWPYVARSAEIEA